MPEIDVTQLNKDKAREGERTKRREKGKQEEEECLCHSARIIEKERKRMDVRHFNGA
jgi:hypothetical protein